MGDNGPNLKIAIFGHETWPLAKVPEVAHITLFLPQGFEIQLIFALRAVVSEISCTYTLFLPREGGGVEIEFMLIEIELILALWAAVSKIRADFQTCHIWA